MTGELAPAPLSRRSARVIGRFAAPRRTRAFWIALWLLAAAAEFGALAPLLFGHQPVEAIDVVFRLVGGSFAACGLIAWHRRPDNRSGLLMTATGFAFFVSPLVSQVDSPAATTVGLWLPDLWMLFFVPLLLTYLSAGRLRTRLDRVLVGGVLLELLVLAPMWLMFDAQEGNLFLLVANPGVADVVDAAQRAVFLAVSFGTAAVIAARYRAATRPSRRAMLPSAAGAACLLLLSLLLAVDLVTGERSQVLLWIAICSLVAVPIAFLTGLLRSQLARGALTELFRGLQTVRPAQLQAALAKALGDPALLIAYPVPGQASYVDTDGEPVRLPEPDGDRSVAMVRRDGAEVAALVYDRSLDDDPELVEAVGAAATIALENSHLHAEAEARLTELRASRERIVAAADAERRRIERNLHDGAQQRLVTLALQLSLIQRQIRQDPADAELLVTSASDELAQSLSELRELARGIHPAVLTERGLAAAVALLAGRSEVPVNLSVTTERFPPAIEAAAYFVVAEGLTNVARYSEASSAAVNISHLDGRLVVEVEDDGKGGADAGRGSGLRGLADRVEVLDGCISLESPEGEGTRLRAEFEVP
jgi:signal transduction histidine kinase